MSLDEPPLPPRPWKAKEVGKPIQDLPWLYASVDSPVFAPPDLHPAPVVSRSRSQKASDPRTQPNRLISSVSETHDHRIVTPNEIEKKRLHKRWGADLAEWRFSKSVAEPHRRYGVLQPVPAPRFRTHPNPQAGSGGCPTRKAGLEKRHRS